VTLATLLIVPARLMVGLATPLRDTGDMEVAVKAVSRPERAASAAPVGEVWSEVEVMGETGSMKGSVAKESWGRVGVEPGGACLA
jgi:hypothetical protein